MLLFPALLLLFLLPVVLCAEDFYKLLGLDKDASDKEIKKAYRRLSKQFHPDKNPGDEAAHGKFVAIADAYDCLINPEQRKIYDQYGHEGLEQHKRGGGRQQHHDPFDLFSRFFGGSGHFGHGGERRGPNMEVKVSIPLRDFYNGRETDFSVEKQGICEHCEGSGSADGKVDTCSSCGGRGMKIQRHMLAPGMFQQVQSPCDACSGQGQIIRNKCSHCGGAKVVRISENHDLHIERGMPKGRRVVYENEADDSPDWVAGDLVIHLDEQDPRLESEEEHRNDGTFFRRKGDDLYWREVLSLREAWMGDWTRNITHLDGHIVHLGRKRGEVIQPGLVELVKGEGMPIWHEDNNVDIEFGQLHVEYIVVLPDLMDKSMEKDFWSTWEKWRAKKGVDLGKDSGRPERKASHDEL